MAHRTVTHGFRIHMNAIFETQRMTLLGVVHLHTRLYFSFARIYLSSGQGAANQNNNFEREGEQVEGLSVYMTMTMMTMSKPQQQLQRRRRPGIFCALSTLASLCCLLRPVGGNLLDAPNVLWTYSLEGGNEGIAGRNMRKGNAVVSDGIGDMVFATADDGSLHILDTSVRDSATPVAVFEPGSSDDDGTDKFTECHSGVSIVESTIETGPGGRRRNERYLVYAVIDTPIVSGVQVDDEGNLEASDANDSVTSRILGVNMDGSLRWSVTVDGRVVGTPLPGQNGEAIYFSRNEEGGSKGYISVVLTTTEPPELAASIAPVDRDGPFGPVTVTSAGNNNNNPPNNNNNDEIPSPLDDVVAVAESWGEGYVEQGSVYIMVPSPEYEDWGGRGNDSYQLRLASSWPFSSVVRPLLSGSAMLMAGTAANLAGWRDISGVLEGREEDVEFRWSVQLDQSPRNASQPFLSAPVANSEGGLVFIPGVSNQLHCFQSDNGKEEWTDQEGNAILSEPKLFESDDGTSVLYVIEALDGRVRQHDIDKGDRNWEFSCSDLFGVPSCFDAVEAEFSVRESGNVLYYGDVFGRIVALEVAEYETQTPTSAPSEVPSLTPSVMPSASPQPSTTPSESPSVSPTGLPSESPSSAPFRITTSPTAVASESPTSMPTPTSQTASPSVLLVPSPPVAPIFDEFDELSGLESNQPDDEEETDYLPYIIGAGAGGFFVIAIAVFFIARTKSKSRRESEKDRGVLILEDVSDDDLEGGSATTATTGSATTATTNDNLDVEVVGGSAVYSPKSTKPKKKKKKKKHRNQSPVTPQTLECIEESPDDFSQGDDVVLVDHDDDPSAKKNLNNQFQYVAEIDSDAESLEPGTAGTAGNGSHLELAVGNNRLKPLLSQDDSDSGSWNMSAPGSVDDKNNKQQRGKATTSARGVPPRSVDVPKSEEEKKDDSSNLAQFSPRGTQPGASQPSADMSPMTATSEKSSESSVFVDDDSTGGRAKQNQGQDLSPLSPHILSKSLDESVPEDEASGINGASLLAPSLGHKYNTRDEVSAPGSHYMSAKSARTPPRGGNSKYGQSVRSKRDLSSFKSSPDKTPSSVQAEAASPKKPSFKRRSKRDERPATPQEEPKEEPTDMWSSFLQDLADAEEKFFSPSAAQRKSLLVDDDAVSAASEDILPAP